MKPRTLWSPEEDADLRRIYAMTSSGAASAALKAFAERKGVTRQRCRLHAYTLRLTRVAGGHRAWTEDERDTLRFYKGVLPAWKIARKIKRSEDSVRTQLFLMGLGQRVEQRGYTRKELADLMGIDLGYTFRRLLKKFPMATNGIGNFSNATVAGWVWDHLDELELRKFDQLWLKSILRRAA